MKTISSSISASPASGGRGARRPCRRRRHLESSDPATWKPLHRQGDRRSRRPGADDPSPDGIDRDALTYDLTLAATVQEEIGLIGATSLAKRGDFDLAIAIDNGPIGDYPGVDPREMPVELGKGPVVVYKDSWAHYDRRVINRIIDVAEAKNIHCRKRSIPALAARRGLDRAGIPADTARYFDPIHPCSFRDGRRARCHRGIGSGETIRDGTGRAAGARPFIIMGAH